MLLFRGIDSFYMREALIEARAAARRDEVPVGAVLVNNISGEIIARAQNSVERTSDPTAHAEMLALREGARVLNTWRLSECTLYVTLEPCAMCAGATISARLGRLVFGAFEERTGCCGSIFDLTTGVFLHGMQTIGGILEDECAELMKDYFRGKRT